MGSNQLSTTQMNAYTSFINTVVYMPNPNQNLDRSFQTSLAVPGATGKATGNAVNGKTLFSTLRVATISTCNSCHTAGNGFGSNLLIQVTNAEPQVLKVPQLRITYQKQFFSEGGPTIDGFGITTEGDHTNLIQFLSLSTVFPGLIGKTQDMLDLAAYNLSFDTGMAPSVGYSRTLTAASLSITQVVSDWTTLEAQAKASDCDLVANGTVRGAVTGLVYSPALAKYVSTSKGTATYTHAQIVAFVEAGDTLSVMGVPHGSSGLYAGTGL
jgi:hypothetical protein